MEALATGPAGQTVPAAAVGTGVTAARAAGNPAGGLHRHGIGVAHAHRELRLSGIDRCHPAAEVGAVHLPHPQHPVDPGVDHLVAEGAEGGLARQGLQQRPGEHDLAEVGAIGAAAAAIETGGAGEAAVTPAQVHQGPALAEQGALEMLAVQPVEQGRQRFQGHGGGTDGMGAASKSGRSGPHGQRGPGQYRHCRAGSSVRLSSLQPLRHPMDWDLARGIGSKALFAGAGALLLYWTISAVKLVLSARGINPLIKQFFTQVASGQVDGAYLLTTKNYRSHVNRQQFIRFLAGLQLNKFRNLKSGRPRLQDDQVMLTVKLKSDGKEELPLDFTFVKVDEAWRVDRIQKVGA